MAPRDLSHSPPHSHRGHRSSDLSSPSRQIYHDRDNQHHRKSNNDLVRQRRGRSRSLSLKRERSSDRRRHGSGSRSRSRSPKRSLSTRRRSRSRSLTGKRPRSRSESRESWRHGQERRRSRSRSRGERRKRVRNRSMSSSSESDYDSRRRKGRKKDKETKRNKSKDRRKEKKKEKREKEKKEQKEKKKHASGAAHWGKYGIISESDIFIKAAEFHTWLVEERKINPETITKDQSKKEFAKYVEDFNTATLPHEKYYHIEAYERRMSALRSGEFVPPPDYSYDPQADMKAISSAHKKKLVEYDSYLSKEQLTELRKVQNERIEAGKMKLLGMEVKQNMGIRMDGTVFE